MADCKHLLQQRIATSEQNAVFAQSDGDKRRVEIGLHQCDIVDLGVTVDGTYYCDLLLLRQLLPAIRHVSCEFVF